MLMAWLVHSTAKTPPPFWLNLVPYERGEGSWTPQPVLSLPPESHLVEVILPVYFCVGVLFIEHPALVCSVMILALLLFTPSTTSISPF